MELFNKMIAAALKVSVHQVDNTLSLLDGGATIPFISRYRKEATGGLDEVQIGEIRDRNDKLCELAKRKETILSTNKTGCPKMDTLYAFIYFLKLFQHKLEDYRSKPTLIHISSHNINTYRRNPAGNNIHQIMRLNIDRSTA